MAENKDIMVSPQKGMIHNLVVRAKLILRLLGDPRVSVWAKLIAVGVAAYVLWPWDLIPVVPGLDALDDVAIAGVGYYFFLEMCPQDVIQEHLKAIEGTEEKKTSDSNDVVDGEATDVQ